MSCQEGLFRCLNHEPETLLFCAFYCKMQIYIKKLKPQNQYFFYLFFTLSIMGLKFTC